MFDFDAGKLLIIGVIALMVIGPKELPRVLRQVGQTIGRLRRMAAEFQGQFMDAMKEADIQSIRDEVEKIGRESQSHMSAAFDPARDIQAEISKSLEAAPALAPATADASLEHTASPAGGFALPTAGEAVSTEALALASAEQDSDTLAAAGLAPTAGVLDAAEPMLDASASDAMHEAAVPSMAGPGQPALRKRKIILPKRRSPRLSVPHEVTDRTGFSRGRAAGRRLKATTP